MVVHGRAQRRRRRASRPQGPAARGQRRGPRVPARRRRDRAGPRHLARRRRPGRTLAGPPRRHRRDLLPRAFGGRGSGRPRRTPRHCQVTYVLRPARLAARPRRAGGDVGMTLSCADATVALGAYVVGALDPRERADVEAHLAHCPACRDELASLAPLPGLLSRLSLAEAEEGPPPVDDAMLERLLQTADRQRRTATRHRWLAVAAAVVVLAGGTTAGVAGWHSAHATHWQQVAASSGPVHMRV